MIIHAPPVMIYEQHAYGGGRILYDNRTKQNILLVHIPKCASSWIKAVFKHSWHWNYKQGFGIESMPDPLDKIIPQASTRYVTVLRDPIQRWITGFVQTKIREHTDMSWKKIFDKVDFDNHTEPQISFLDGLDTQLITFFYCDKNLSKNVIDWCNFTDPKLFVDPDFSRDWSNSFNLSSRKPSATQDVYKEAQTILKNNPQYVEKLREVYFEDYELIDSVKFYEAR
jgi:hypothetical protein